LHVTFAWLMLQRLVRMWIKNLTVNNNPLAKLPGQSSSTILGSLRSTCT